ncbi:hypothetical protein ES703_113811 [subsurface metagenome]
METGKDGTRKETKFNRRTFLKATGAASAGIGLSGLGLYGYQAGKDPMTYTGCEGFQGAAQSFNRKRFAVDKPHYEKVGPTSRADGRTEVVFSRVGAAMTAARSGTKIENLNEPYRSYYQKHPGR